MRLDRDGLESKTSLKEVRDAGVGSVDGRVCIKSKRWKAKIRENRLGGEYLPYSLVYFLQR